MEMFEYRVNPRHAEHARTGNHDDGGHETLAQSAGGGDGAVHKRRNGVRSAHDDEPLHAVFDFGGILRENA